MMRIRYVDENIFNAKEKFILHGVNSKGVVTRGLPSEMRKRYPIAMTEYEHNTPALGDIQIVHCGDKSIINAVIVTNTPKEKRRYVNYEAVATCMEILEDNLYGQTIALPLIGLGDNWGNWNIISSIIENTLETVTPIVYAKPGEYSKA